MRLRRARGTQALDGLVVHAAGREYGAGRERDAAAFHGPVAPVERRIVADADDDLARDLERDQRRPPRLAGREAQRSVDRVDDPAALAVAARAALLAEDRVARPLAREPLAELVLDRLVDLGHDAAIGLEALLERPAETRERDLARGVGEAQREIEIGVERESRGHRRKRGLSPKKRRPKNTAIRPRSAP